ncbi:hypothetical protein KA001_01610 [Patescibacteria group bacterium]|nr:hypothetical protein [Patescibacteria group bacterium]
MFSKLKQVGETIEAQKKYRELNKKLEDISVEAIEGDVKIRLKGGMSFYKIDYLEIEGKKVDFSKALKKASKDIEKHLRKKFKQGELGDIS